MRGETLNRDDDMVKIEMAKEYYVKMVANLEFMNRFKLCEEIAKMYDIDVHLLFVALN